LKKLEANKKVMTTIKSFTTIVIGSMMIISCGNEKENNSVSSEVNIEEPMSTKNVKFESEAVILFYGNSLTAGYGLDPSQSFPSIIEDKIDSLGLPYQVVNAGLSGETTSGGLQRIDWVLNQDIDIFFLELGANDMLRGLPLKDTKNNLQGIIEKVREKDPSIKIGLFEMLASPNMGADYSKGFTQIYADLAAEEGVKLIPFFLEGVAGETQYLLPDGKHPNAAGQVIVADNIWQHLQPML